VPDSHSRTNACWMYPPDGSTFCQVVCRSTNVSLSRNCCKEAARSCPGGSSRLSRLCNVLPFFGWRITISGRFQREKYAPWMDMLQTVNTCFCLSFFLSSPAPIELFFS
jgi:hypothetical protein